MPRAIAHEQAVAQRRAAEGIAWRRREALVVHERFRLRVATKDDGGVLGAAFTHKPQVEDLAVALALFGEEGARVLNEGQRAPDHREAKGSWWRWQRRGRPRRRRRRH